jgi:acid phosphatase (class A)
MMNVPYPDENTTRNELLHLVELTNNMDSERLEECNLIDVMLYEYWSNYLDSLGVSIPSNQLEGMVIQYEPITDFLKLHYNRPRPFQMAGVMGIPMYPRVTVEGSTDASYPSGHTFLSLCIYQVVGNIYPHIKSDLMKMVLNIKLSREELGVHYPSDGVFSFQVFKHLRPHIV